MNFISYKGIEYKWNSSQDSEHPDVVIYTPKGEIWIQFEIGSHDNIHNERYLNGKEKYPISNSSINKLLIELVYKGYTEDYYDSNYGLIFTEKMELIKN